MISFSITLVTAIATSAEPAPAPRLVPDMRVDAHLAAWEKSMRGIHNLRVEFDLVRTDAAFGKAQEWTGSLLVSKPHHARLRIVEKANPANYEAFIINSRSCFHYDGAHKIMTEHRLNPKRTLEESVDHPPLPEFVRRWLRNLSKPWIIDVFTAESAADVLREHEISMLKEPDASYIYILLKPRNAHEFEEIHLALHRPNLLGAHGRLAYLPAQIFLKRSNGDTESWKFWVDHTNLNDLPVRTFDYEPPPRDWTLHQAPRRAEIAPIPRLVD